MSREPGEDKSQQEIMISKLIIKSQDEMCQRLEKMLCKVLLQSQQQILEILRSSNGFNNHVNTNPSSSSDYKQKKLKKILSKSATLRKEEVINATGNMQNLSFSSLSEDDDDDYEEDMGAIEDGPEHDEQDGDDHRIFDFEGGLFKAAVSGDWHMASEFFKNNPQVKMSNENCNIALRVAILNDRLPFVEELVKLMPPEALLDKTKDNGFTALHSAASYGYTQVAKVLVNKNSDLAQIRDSKGRVPLQITVEAVTVGQKATAKYLYSVTGDLKPSSPFSGPDGARLLCSAIDANLYDMALSLVKRFPLLVTERQIIYQKNHPSSPTVHDICGLESIILRPFAFPSGSKLTWWQRKVYSLTKVDMDSTYNHDAQANEQKATKFLTGTERDIENPQEISESNQVGENNPLKSSEVYSNSTEKGIINIFFASLAYHMPNITQVLRIKHYIYKQKLMHKQALALAKEMFSQLHKTMDKPQLVKYFNANSNIIKTAIKHGTIEVVDECLRKFPYLIWYDLGGQTMIQMAIAERNEKILDLICITSGKEKMDLVSRKDKSGNTLLHHVAELAPPVQLNAVCGAALQVQRELQWFKGVENIMPEDDKVKRNKKGYTAQYMFTEAHKELVEKGGEWMKDTSGSCMVVAALIATVAFAAVFTVPGGNNSESSDPKKGTPIFLGNKSFTVFAIADALALFSSITSVLMFLAIYTSRHSEEDFYKSLPQKLIIGLATLFISMATILVSFGASLFIVLGDRYPWSPYPIALFSCVPLALFVSLQLPLFLEMVRSTFWNSLLQKHRYIQPISQDCDKMD